MPTLYPTGIIPGMQALSDAPAKTVPHRNEAALARPYPEGELPLPRAFGRLRLLKRLAQGGMGDVFLASSGAIDGAERACVVKTIRRDHADDESFLARFLDEARIQSQLQHVGVAQILEAATDSAGKPYVVVEYVEGRNLAEVRVRAAQLGSKLTWEDAVAIAIGMGEGLAYMHECQDASGKSLDIVHRDLSPQNVMVSYSGEVKLIDFGTARAQNRRCRTVAGVVYAKPGYVAPEVANNTPGGIPADIYAFGVMLWELVAGRRFLYGDPAAHLAAVAAGKRSPARLEKVLNCPAELDHILSKLTATLIEQRYRSAKDAVKDLKQLLEGAPSSTEKGSVQARIQQLLANLYPGEPKKSRAEFAELMALAKSVPLAAAEPSGIEAEPSAASLLAGTRYRLARELGRGSSGIVYEAYHVDLDRVFALKLLNPEACHDGAAKERLRAEAKLIFGIEHPNLVKVHDFGFTATGRPFFVMEALSGETLDRYLEKKRGMDFREACQLGIQALNALEAAHERGLVHRDIKLQNLFITESGVLKLLDFGVAKTKSEVIEVEEGALSVIGTPETMSPEQARGQAGDARSDLYSLGAVLYELLTGYPTHQAESLAALLRAKCCQDVKPIRERSPKRGLPKLLERVLAQALERHPELRFANAQAFRAALTEVLLKSRRGVGQQRALWCAAAGIVVALTGSSAVELLRPGWLASGKAGVVRQLGEAQLVGSQELASILQSTPVRRLLGDELNAGPIAPEIRRTLASDLALNAARMPLLRLAEPEKNLTALPAPLAPLTTPEAPALNEIAPAPIDDEVARGLQEIDVRIERGNLVTALALARKLGKQHPNDPRTQKVWSEVAAKSKAWGEALRVARQWADIDPGTDAQLQLVRMLRRAGQRDEAERYLARGG